MAKDRYDLPLYLSAVIIGLAAILGSLKLPFYGDYGPGAGFLPFWSGLGILAAGAYGVLKLAIISRIRGEGTDTCQSEKSQTKVKFNFFDKFWLNVLGLIGFCLLIEPLGFLLATGALLIYLLVFVERRPFVQSTVLALLAPLLIWLVFVRLLGINLPGGILG